MIRQEGEREDLRLNMAPMIDMVFLLIIFFLTATTFTQREREQDVLLPTNTNPGSLSRNVENNLIVNVFRDGKVRVFGEVVDDRQLVALVRDRRERARQPLKVLVRADRRAAWEEVSDALAAVERGGVQRPYIVTRKVELGE
jgi:biopolymer transport protein ExbD